MFKGITGGVQRGGETINVLIAIRVSGGGAISNEPRKTSISIIIIRLSQ
jgi:hypothetical protein